MFNILISNTDPYSFMGLIKASSTGRTITSSLRGVISAGFASLLLMFAITHMAEVKVETNLTKGCSPEVCKIL